MLFTWNDETEKVFNKLKEIMVSSLVLCLPDFSKPFIVETDTCGVGVGAVLSQGNGPIAFLNKALGVKNLALSTYEKEFLPVLWQWISGDITSKATILLSNLTSNL